MRQSTGDRCTCSVGVQRSSADKISCKTQCRCQDPDSQPSGSHTTLVFTGTTKAGVQKLSGDNAGMFQSTGIKRNRVDARFVDRGRKTVTLLEMSCPWVENRKLKRQHLGYEVRQYNIIIVVLGGYSQETSDRVRNLLGPLEDTF